AKYCGYAWTVYVGMVRYTSWVMFTVAARCSKLNFAASHGMVTSLPPLSTIRYSTCPASSKTMSSTVPMFTFPWIITLVPSTCLTRYAVVGVAGLSALVPVPGTGGGGGGGGFWATATETPSSSTAADPRRIAVFDMAHSSWKEER